MGGGEGQTYCLRWNNHKTNLVEILDVLFQKRGFVDCTLHVDDTKFFVHRVVLAANSSYFQKLLQDLPMDHCTILFPGIQGYEMQALLDYMYTGEVNVTQSQIPRIIQIAEELEVKGLFDMTDLKDKFDKNNKNDHPPYPGSIQTPQINNNKLSSNQQSSPIISQSANISSSVQSSSGSPPYSYKSGYLFGQGSTPSSADCPPPQWPMNMAAAAAAHLTVPTRFHNAAAAALGSAYDGNDMNPLKRKKLSSINSMLQGMPPDTPILRTVLAQPHVVDSSQPARLSIHERERGDSSDRSDRHSTYSNGTDYSDKKNKYGEPPQSPVYRYGEDETGHNLSANDSRNASLPSAPASNQKPEWKRYKQYTRQDLSNAIEAVKEGMSALAAARIFKVPSRTLYDKVKKLGIAAARPMNRAMKRSPSNNSSPASFPYGISGTRSPLQHMEGQSHSQSGNDAENLAEIEQRERLATYMAANAMCDPNIFLKAGREAFAAIAAANGIKNIGRPLSPSAMYPTTPVPAASNSPQSPMHEDDEENENDEEFERKPIHLTNELPQEDDVRDRNSIENERSNDEEEDDHVEDLSMNARIKKTEKISPPQSPASVINVPETTISPPNVQGVIKSSNDMTGSVNDL